MAFLGNASAHFGAVSPVSGKGLLGEVKAQFRLLADQLVDYLGSAHTVLLGQSVQLVDRFDRQHDVLLLAIWIARIELKTTPSLLDFSDDILLLCTRQILSIKEPQEPLIAVDLLPTVTSG